MYVCVCDRSNTTYIQKKLRVLKMMKKTHMGLLKTFIKAMERHTHTQDVFI